MFLMEEIANWILSSETINMSARILLNLIAVRVAFLTLRQYYKMQDYSSMEVNRCLPLGKGEYESVYHS